ncbi:hypothetical protein BU15DRAFT_82938 [Melanogaster broomeanus]|nr:hypothetical protein BU15DRAFT_82938 [Melanogaster broomeanus]
MKESISKRLAAEKKFLLQALRLQHKFENETRWLTIGSPSPAYEGSIRSGSDLPDMSISSKTTVFGSTTSDSVTRGPYGWSVEHYSEWVKRHDILKTRLEQVNKLLQEVVELTSECYEDTGYRGFCEWAKKSFDLYAPMCDSILAASAFGAGITYTAVFSAIWGNLSLICWAFNLFGASCIISLFVRSSLLWCSRDPSTRAQSAVEQNLHTAYPKQLQIFPANLRPGPGVRGIPRIRHTGGR